MRFKIINSNRSIKSLDKQGQNEAETRPNSSSKSNSKHSFLQMVKNSYQYYSTIGKDVLIEQQIKAAQQKQQQLKKQNKKLNLKEVRQYQKQSQANQQMQEIERQIRKAKRQDQKNKKIKKASSASTRVSKRIKANDISHIFKKQDNQLFDVLNLEPSKIALQEEKTIQVHQKKIDRKQRLKENIQKLKEQLIFQQEGTYQINLAHQVMLKAQQSIDQHINFKHEVRQSKVMDMNELIKYMKIHGFSTFNEKTFSLLTSINPYLYSYRETVQANKIVINTFKLNSIQISQRLESTRRRMSQVSVPELLT